MCVDSRFAPLERLGLRTLGVRRRGAGLARVRLGGLLFLLRPRAQLLGGALGVGGCLFVPAGLGPAGARFDPLLRRVRAARPQHERHQCEQRPARRRRSR